MVEDDGRPGSIFRYISVEERLPRDHPLRAIRALVDDVLRDMSHDFDSLYASAARPSVPPEQVLTAQLLQLLYAIRSDHVLLEQLEYNLLFRWFVGLEIDQPPWTLPAFAENRAQLLNRHIPQKFFRRVV